MHHVSLTEIPEYDTMNSLTSAAVAEYLAENSHFFEEHAELLSKIKLTSPLAARTVSLQERQMEVLR